mgnify:CR=1 FL=1
MKVSPPQVLGISKSSNGKNSAADSENHSPTSDRTTGPLASVPDDRPWVLVTAHRRENFGAPLDEIFAAIWRDIDPLEEAIERDHHIDNDVLFPLLDRMKASVRRYNDSGPIAMGYRLGHVVGDGSNFRAIVYNKSMVVLDLLGRLIGQDVFDRGLRRFYQEMQFRKAGADDLRRAMEAESGQPLGRFFDRWVHESDLPQVSLSAVVEHQGDAAVIRIVQTGPVFDLPVTLTIAYADGPAGSVTLAVHDAVTERRIPLAGRVKPGGIRLVPVL